MNEQTSGEKDPRIEYEAVSAELLQIVEAWRRMARGKISREAFDEMMESNYGLGN